MGKRLVSVGSRLSLDSVDVERPPRLQHEAQRDKPRRRCRSPHDEQAAAFQGSVDSTVQGPSPNHTMLGPEFTHRLAVAQTDWECEVRTSEAKQVAAVHAADLAVAGHACG